MTKDFSKLKWACRRGMLELDVLLNNFLVEAYPQLTSDNQLLFAELLSAPDPELISWLMGFEEPADTKLLAITELIRKHARSRI